MPEDTRPFTVRFSEELVDQIDARRKITKRSRSAECEYLIEKALDDVIKQEQASL